MSGVGIIITDEAAPFLARVRTAAARRGILAVLGESSATVVRDHLYALNTERHKYGRNYYAQAADKTNWTILPNGVKISINQVGMRQRYYGGVIKPRRGKYLTIPAAPEAHGMRAREFNDLDFGFAPDPRSGGLRPALIRRASTTLNFRRRVQKDGSVRFKVTPREVNEGKVMYWLVRKVTQRADSTVLPATNLIMETALTAARRRIERLNHRADRNLDFGGDN